MSSELSETKPILDAIGYEGGLHCDLRVTDLPRALEWYSNALGCAVIHHVPDAGWAEVQSPVASVRIGLTAVEEMPSPGGGAVLTFNVRDIEIARRYLESRDDVRFEGETCTIEGWVRLATVFDPDGNVLMFAESLLGRDP